MHSKANRRTTCSLRTLLALGSTGALILPLAIFSDPLHPISTAPPPSAPIRSQAAVSLEGVIFEANPPGYDPDLDVHFSDGHFGSDVPADNGAAWHLQRFR